MLRQCHQVDRDQFKMSITSTRLTGPPSANSRAAPSASSTYATRQRWSACRRRSPSLRGASTQILGPNASPTKCPRCWRSRGEESTESRPQCRNDNAPAEGKNGRVTHQELGYLNIPGGPPGTIPPRFPQTEIDQSLVVPIPVRRVGREGEAARGLPTRAHPYAS